MATRSGPIRIIQVSDTHVSAKRAYFVDNWEVFLTDMAARQADLVVHTGDVSFDGAGDAEDLAFAKSQKNRIPVEWLAIPGNHDIGESSMAVRLDQPVNDDRIDAWRTHFGAQWWTRDLGQWRLIGIDTSLLGSGRSEETEQYRVLEHAFATRNGRPVLLFQHMPPFVNDPEDQAFTTHAVPHGPRQRLLDMCADGGVRVIACGHLHVYQQRAYRGMQIVWAPATSFFNIVDRQTHGFGVPRAGYVEWTLDGDHISHVLIEPPLMITHDVGAWNAAHGSTTKMPPRPLAAPRNTKISSV